MTTDRKAGKGGRWRARDVDGRKEEKKGRKESRERKKHSTERDATTRRRFVENAVGRYREAESAGGLPLNRQLRDSSVEDARKS